MRPIPIVKSHKALYLIAISTVIVLIALSQWIFCVFLQTQSREYSIIDLAREQQLLGQKLAMLGLQIRQDSYLDAYWNELMDTEQVWTGMHHELHHRLPPELQAEQSDLLLQVQSSRERIASAVQSLFLEFDDEKFLGALQAIQLLEPDYQRAMAAIHQTLETRVVQRTEQFKWIGLVVGIAVLLILWLEYSLIFQPALKLFKQQNHHLNQSYLEKERMNEELNTLETRLRHSLNIQKTISDNLKKAKSNAEQASQAKGNFLSTMSHEIRTPLNSILGLTHLLLDDQPQPNQIKNLEALHYSAQNLKSLINNILDLSKIESGQIDLEREPFNIHDVVQGVFQSLKVQADEKGIALTLEVDDQIPRFVSGDATRLSQILNNLVSNAIKFTLEGYVSIRLKRRKKNTDSVSIRFEVEDTGIGISDDKIDTIFEEFTQAELNTTRKFGGTGLGLAITKKLLQLLGSDIQVESSLHQGTTFFFKLNYEPVDEAVHQKEIQTTRSTQGTLAGLRVLVAEDNKLNIIVIRQFLKKWDIHFDEAGNGRQALALAQKRPYDVILMDVNMPVMDGLTAAKRIREAGLMVPIVALTASAFTDIKEKLEEAGIFDFTTKPFVPEALFETLAKYRTTSATQNSHEANS